MRKNMLPNFFHTQHLTITLNNQKHITEKYVIIANRT